MEVNKPNLAQAYSAIQALNYKDLKEPQRLLCLDQLEQLVLKLMEKEGMNEHSRDYFEIKDVDGIKMPTKLPGYIRLWHFEVLRESDKAIMLQAEHAKGWIPKFAVRSIPQHNCLDVAIKYYRQITPLPVY